MARITVDISVLTSKVLEGAIVSSGHRELMRVIRGQLIDGYMDGGDFRISIGKIEMVKYTMARVQYKVVLYGNKTDVGVLLMKYMCERGNTWKEAKKRYKYEDR